MKKPQFVLPALATGALLLAGCGGGGGRVARGPAPPPSWRIVATPADRERIRTWRDAWVQALAKARVRHAAAIDAAGAVLQPDAALEDPTPPPGAYRCRLFKLGALAAENLDYADYPTADCTIAADGALLRFAERGGTQRPAGKLYPATPERMVFLGSLVLSDEKMAMGYGRDPDRDLAGTFERIGARHWRLVLPFPHWESTLQVIDLVPAD